ncbi:RAMP superfamily CRISPR-associated protein [Desulfolithobacter sp.]
MQTIYLKLTVASLVSIGCDEVYEPTGFVVDEEACELISFDTYEFLRMLDDDALRRFSGICAKGSIGSLLELMRFMRQNREHAEGERCGLAREFIDHYRQVLGMKNNARHIQQNLNRFQISRTAFNPHTNLPVIPGSSIKGAIRTAVLNLRNNGRSFPSFRGKQASRELQEHLLNFRTRELAGDPFRLVKVSDFVPTGNFRRRIIYAANLKKRPSGQDFKRLYQILEVIEPGAEFLGTITVQQPAGRRVGIKDPLTWQEIQQALQQFYGTENRRENRELSSIGTQPLQLNTQGLPLRIGRHSGAECVTVFGHRSIKVSPPGKKPFKFKDHATTLWLAAESKTPGPGAHLQPFGWSMLYPVTENDKEKLKKSAHILEQNKLKELAARAEQYRAEAKQLARKAAQEEAEKKKKAKEAERMAAEKARRLGEAEEKWGQMREIDRYVAIVLNNDEARIMAPNRNGLRDIWPKLDNLEPEEQKAVARAFYELWSGQEKLWRKKMCSPGQWERVERIVTLLHADHPDIKQIAPEEQELVDRITGLRDWNAFSSSGIKIESLPLVAAEQLEKQLAEWGCNNKKAKKNKQKAWKAIKAHLRSLRRNH